MKKWKQAYMLATHELKHSAISLLLLIGILIGMLILIVPIFPSYLEEATLALDLVFFVLFISVSQSIRPKVFRQQKLSGLFYASHHLIHLNELPIKREIIARYRFITYIIISVSFHVLFLSLLYIFTPALQMELTVSKYVTFCIIWICFSIYIGSGQIASEVGSNILISIIAMLFIAPLLFVATIFLFYKLYNNNRGIVRWTIQIANDYPLLALVISTLLAIIGAFYWIKRMEQKMWENDYF